LAGENGPLQIITYLLISRPRLSAGSRGRGFSKCNDLGNETERGSFSLGERGDLGYSGYFEKLQTAQSRILRWNIPRRSSLSDLTDRLDSNAMPIVKLIFQSMNKGFQIEILDSNAQGLFLLSADEFKLRAVLDCTRALGEH
jgi:hypothetical protein